MTNSEKFQIEKLKEYKHSIEDSLIEIENILRLYFPKEYEKAIQFYIPQIATGLQSEDKWLSRGEYSLQNTIDHLTKGCKSCINDESLKKYL